MALGMISFQPLKTAVASTVIDDAMYYPKISGNIIKLGSMTYDGITITNGFHPLWLYCLLPISWIIRQSDNKKYVLPVNHLIWWRK